jgi:hypothetical protein
LIDCWHSAGCAGDRHPYWQSNSLVAYAAEVMASEFSDFFG